MAMQTKLPKYQATSKQIAFIQTLCDERGIDVVEILPPEAVDGWEYVAKYTASQMIKQLMATPKTEEQVPVAAPSLLELATAIEHGVAHVEPAAEPVVIDRPTFTDDELKAISGAFGVVDMEVGEFTDDEQSALDKITVFLAAIEAGVKTKPIEPVAKPATLALGNAAEHVPAGHYAVTGNDGSTDFYKVDYGKPGGNWAGFLFLTNQQGDEYAPVKNPATKLAIIAKIAADTPLEAAKRYGTELGPVCAAKLGA